uniref:Zinc finger CCCH domain-containing protein 13 n=1 Tax=Steinernema glaseri TaxID=37863 RepID=A0A1I7YAH1_9BILA
MMTHKSSARYDDRGVLVCSHRTHDDTSTLPFDIGDVSSTFPAPLRNIGKQDRNNHSTIMNWTIHCNRDLTEGTNPFIDLVLLKFCSNAYLPYTNVINVESDFAEDSQMEADEAVVSAEQEQCEAGELVEEEEEGQIIEDEAEKEAANGEGAAVEENGAADPSWSLGDEEGEIVDDDEPESSSFNSNHRKRRYSGNDRNNVSQSVSPAPEDKKTAFEKFRNLSFSKKNPFADGSGRDTRSDLRSSRFRPDRDGGNRYRRDDIRDEEARRREKRYERERREADERLRNRMSSGREINDRESRRGYNSAVNHVAYGTPPSQPHSAYGGHGLPGSLWERIDMFIHAPENQLPNLSDDEIYDKLIELLELQNEQNQLIRRREKQIDELRCAIDHEHDEIDRIKMDLPPDYFIGQTNGSSDGHLYVDSMNNGPPGVPLGGPYADRKYLPPMDTAPPPAQYAPMGAGMPPPVNGIRGYQPNIPPPPGPHMMPPPPVFTNPPPFDAARPPPPIVSETIGGIAIPPHLAPHSMKSSNAPVGTQPIPLVPDFSVPPPGFVPAPTIALRTNSPGVNVDRFSSGPTYANDRYGRPGPESYNRDRYATGDRFMNTAPTPLRNVVPAVQNTNLPQSSSWTHSSYQEDDHCNRGPPKDDIVEPSSKRSHLTNDDARAIEETHEPVSAPASVVSAVSEEYPNGVRTPSAPKEEQPETYDVVSDDEDGVNPT